MWVQRTLVRKMNHLKAEVRSQEIVVGESELRSEAGSQRSVPEIRGHGSLDQGNMMLSLGGKGWRSGLPGPVARLHACVSVSSQFPALIMLTCHHPWASLRTPSLCC